MDVRVRKPGFRSGQGDLAVAGITTWLFAGVTTPVGLTRQVPFSAIPGSVEGVPDTLFCRQRGDGNLTFLLGLPRTLKMLHSASIHQVIT